MIMERQQQAIASFQAGYNCCQAIVLAYRAELKIDERTAIELGASYGGGRYQGLCGALAGCYIVTNQLKGTPKTNDPAECVGAATEKIIDRLNQDFQQACGSLYCKEIIGKRPCSEYVGEACRILEKQLAVGNK
ncbi:C-GCAxxG-C-C family protein [Enterococcus sp. DIV0800]|uniref:C-GCAxxG-C-C family protein n=1 Tax=unclassified Enterococcus TaxID=2608891 RepID=UPI003D300A94